MVLPMYVFMAYIFRDYIAMAYIVMPYMAYLDIACIVIALWLWSTRSWLVWSLPHRFHSRSCGRYGYGLIAIAYVGTAYIIIAL